MDGNLLCQCHTSAQRKFCDIVISCDSVVCVCVPEQDAAFNKTTRGLQELQQKDLGVKADFRSVQHM